MMQILNVRYHDFKQVQIQNNIVLAKCVCCSKPRYAVIGDKNFFYHGYDGQYANKLFSSLSSRSQA